MSIVKILQDGDPVLRQKTEPVPKELFGTPKLKKMVADMADTLEVEKDGVAIAATQIGLPYRIFLIRYDRITPPPKEGEPPHKPELGVFINPEYVRLSKKGAEMDEGCLSVRHVYGKTIRKERATVRAQDADGKKFERGGGKVLAQAFQHEIDHLEGILFIDHAHDLLEIRAKDEYEPV
ncbi:MAG: peptide deformylase [Minisyncoccia bacterium]